MRALLIYLFCYGASTLNTIVTVAVTHNTDKEIQNEGDLYRKEGENNTALGVALMRITREYTSQKSITQICDEIILWILLY